MSSTFSEFTQPGKKPVVDSIFDFSAEALGQLRLWFEQNPPSVPITSVLGFNQFTAQLNTTAGLTLGAGVTGSGAGPGLSGLSAGKYVVLAGFDVSGVNTPTMTISPGGTVVSLATRGTLLTLATGSSTITSTLAGQGGGAGGSISNPWLLAIRYANQ